VGLLSHQCRSHCCRFHHSLPVFSAALVHSDLVPMISSLFSLVAGSPFSLIGRFHVVPPSPRFLRRSPHFRIVTPVSAFVDHRHPLVIVIVARCSLRCSFSIVHRRFVVVITRFRIRCSLPSLPSFHSSPFPSTLFHSGYFRFPASRYHHGITFAPITIVRYPLPGLSRRRP